MKMFILSRVKDVYFFKSKRCLSFHVFRVALRNTKYFKSAENLRNYKISLVLRIHHGAKISTVKGEVRVNLEHAGIHHYIVNYNIFTCTTREIIFIL